MESAEATDKPVVEEPHRPKNVFLFVPNVIGKARRERSSPQPRSRFIPGYVRVVLSITSFYFMSTHPYVSMSCYLTSEFLDVLDGYAARVLNQCKQARAAGVRRGTSVVSRHEIWCYLRHARRSVFNDGVMFRLGQSLSDMDGVLSTVDGDRYRQPLASFTRVGTD